MAKPAYPIPDDRAAILRDAQRQKMTRSAHANVRGSTLKFYEWLDASAGKIPQGPAVWICGDCHSGNLGPVASARGQVAVQIRDLDQTVIGNPAHDLIRLGLSLATAARGSNLPGVTTALMIEHMVEGYEAELQGGPNSPATAQRRSTHPPGCGRRSSNSSRATRRPTSTTAAAISCRARPRDR